MNITYTPAANYNGAGSFTFKANDDQFDSNVVTVSITVSAFNDPPTASDQSATTAQTTPITLSASDEVLGVLVGRGEPADSTPESPTMIGFRHEPGDGARHVQDRPLSPG